MRAGAAEPVEHGFAQPQPRLDAQRAILGIDQAELSKRRSGGERVRAQAGDQALGEPQRNAAPATCRARRHVAGDRLGQRDRRQQREQGRRRRVEQEAVDDPAQRQLRIGLVEPPRQIGKGLAVAAVRQCRKAGQRHRLRDGQQRVMWRVEADRAHGAATTVVTSSPAGSAAGSATGRSAMTRWSVSGAAGNVSPTSRNTVVTW